MPGQITPEGLITANIKSIARSNPELARMALVLAMEFGSKESYNPVGTPMLDQQSIDSGEFQAPVGDELHFPNIELELIHAA